MNRCICGLVEATLDFEPDLVPVFIPSLLLAFAATDKSLDLFELPGLHLSGRNDDLSKPF